MMAKSFRLAALLACAASVSAPACADTLDDGFANPPQSARPRVWWHWMNGNVTQDGIDKDLAWMQATGIGGVQNFDANLMTPQIVKQRLVFMTPEWKAAFRHAVEVADARGLEFAIAASPGWSETGGPWVKPEDAMKKLVWSQTDLAGGQRVTGALAAPPATTGAFQTAAFRDAIPVGPPGAPPPQFYRDAVVLAFPLAVAPLPQPVASIDGGAAIAAAPLLDGDLESTVEVPKGDATHPGAIVLDYGRAVTIRSASVFVPGARSAFGNSALQPVLQADTGGAWRTIGSVALTEATTTIAFPAVTARRFRLVLAANPDSGKPVLGDSAPGAVAFDIFGKPPGATVAVGAFSLSAEAKVDRFETKAGFTVALDYYKLGQGDPAAAAIDPANVIDLTSHLRADGSLDWTAPRGTNWRIVRLGYALTGTTNHPATAEATGLEVDKYDAAAVRRYLETYLAMYRDTVGPDLMGAHGIRALLTDSIEVGPSNWTPNLVAEFKARRGYDPVPFLPALTGAVIGSAARSEAFLHDFRLTLSDLIADAHYGTVASVAHEHGLKLYGEALEDQRPVLGDDLAMRTHADVPMAALWTFNRGSPPRPTLLGDMKGAASVAHIYGQNTVSAESMTAAFSPWAYAPADLKRVIDLEFASGVNLPIIHTSVHQPVDDKVPGLSLMIFGQYFNRHETWAGMARPWIDYIARTGFLLQQGHDHADIAWFYGEEQPITALFAQGAPADLPKRFAYDFVNADILAHKLTVADGRLVAASGASYHALYLGGSSRIMTLATLQRIAALVEGGATVIGTKPESSPGMVDDAVAFKALADKLWGGQPMTTLGKGRVIVGGDPETALIASGVAPDFAVSGDAADSDYRFVHRTLPDGELYFVNNRQNRAEHIEARFAVSGRQPEIWRAIGGTREAVSYRIEGGQTVVPLDVGPEDAFFLVFRKPATAPGMNVAPPVPHIVQTLSAPWTVAFQPGRGAPAQVAMPVLQPLDTSSDPGVRYFSGTATYSSSFTLAKLPPAGAPLWIDLGAIGDVAQVSVNGQPAGTTWFAPYRLDIARLAKPGRNTITVSVANLWVNRLIGDAQPGAKPITFTALPTYRPDAPLRRSGLIGPVTLQTAGH
ncbi:glycosyl hydrolase [Novosphingobium lentum]|uniref:glycosyl hydrolase n=1 Tax=Novosphingobium lentum TaxID=145287 RepID=UPI00082F3C4F|nr:glycosyl hydrolase [Novosphingobium lentum]